MGTNNVIDIKTVNTAVIEKDFVKIKDKLMLRLIAASKIKNKFEIIERAGSLIKCKSENTTLWVDIKKTTYISGPNPTTSPNKIQIEMFQKAKLFFKKFKK